MALQPESEVDVLVGIGGTPEGIVAACATACMGGAIFGRLAPRNEAGAAAGLDAWVTTACRVLTTTDLVRGENAYFVATGVTDGDVLRRRAVLRRPGRQPVADDAVAHRRGAADRDQAPAEHLDHRPAAELSAP